MPTSVLDKGRSEVSTAARRPGSMCFLNSQAQGTAVRLGLRAVALNRTRLAIDACTTLCVPGSSVPAPLGNSVLRFSFLL